jgi:hypothetical protein
MFLSNNDKMIFAISLLFVIMFIFLNQGSKPSYADKLTPIYNLSNTPPGMSYGELMTKYWDWWVNLPEKQASECPIKVTGTVVFLSDALKSHRELTCTYNLDEGKALFLPLIMSESDKGVEGYEQYSDQQLIDASIKENEGGSFILMIDGKEIPKEDIKKLQTTSPFWNLSILPGNQYQAENGTFRAVTEGIYVLVKPLSQGSHVISYDVSSTKDDPPTTIRGKLTYNLSVK